jgi:hypothetical protein
MQEFPAGISKESVREIYMDGSNFVGSQYYENMKIKSCWSSGWQDHDWKE